MRVGGSGLVEGRVALEGLGGGEAVVDIGRGVKADAGVVMFVVVLMRVILSRG